MCGNPILTEKIEEIQNREWEFLKMVEIGVKQTLKQRVSLQKNIYDNEKYLRTTKYVTINLPQKLQEKHF